MSKLVLASDGLIARVNGLYARKKLAFLDYYLPGALSATGRKHSRHFIDLFAGPGRSKTKGPGIEFDGSTLLAARARCPAGTAFQTVDAYNIHRSSHEALQARIERMPDRACQFTRSHLGDGLRDGRERLRKLDRLGAYAFVFLDIEAPGDLPWTAIEAIRRAAPKSTDAYFLFPVGMALLRQLNYSPADWDAQAPSLTRFYGDESWRGAADFRRSDTPAYRKRVMHSLLEAYCSRLSTLWKWALPVRRVTRDPTAHVLYYMILATSHDAGRNIADWGSRPAAVDPQFRLGFD